MKERRKKRLRRKIAELVPILILFSRRRKPLEEKEIAHRLNVNYSKVNQTIRIFLRKHQIS